MSNVLYFPGCGPKGIVAFDSDNFDLLVASIVKAVSNVHIDYRKEMGPTYVWFEVIREFLISEGIQLNMSSVELARIGPQYVDIWRSTIEKRLLSDIRK